jgi:formylmethanofuran dehydrogenase subunit C
MVLLTMTVFAFAGAKARSLEISIVDPTSVAGVQLKAGEYQVKINAEETVATFYREGSEVARVAVHNQPSASKFSDNEFIFESQTLKAIHVGGTMDNLVIDGPASTK